MRKIYFYVLYVVISLTARQVHSQGFEMGKLWLRTTDTLAIPIYDNEGNITNNIKPEIDSLFTQMNVFLFEKAFPLAEQIDPDTDLKNVYELGCFCNVDTLIQNLGSYYYGVEKIPFKDSIVLLYQPNDYPLVGSNWLDSLFAREAYDITKGDPDVPIAIIDGGIHLSNCDLVDDPSLPPSYVQKLKYVELPGGLTNDPDFNVHGTMVATTAAGRFDNNAAVGGVGFDCSLMFYSFAYYTNDGSCINSCLTICDNLGGANCSTVCGNYCSSSDFVKDLFRARINGAEVANMSISAGGPSQTIQDAVNLLAKDGLVMVAAAGNAINNDATSYYYPASLDNVYQLLVVMLMDNIKVPKEMIKLM